MQVLRGRLHGHVLLLMLVVLVLGSLIGIAGSLNAPTDKFARSGANMRTLLLAKEALIGKAASQSPILSAAYIELPDLGQPAFGIILETAVEMAGHAGRLVPQQFRETCAKCRAVEPKSLRSLWHKAFHLTPPVNCGF